MSDARMVTAVPTPEDAVEASIRPQNLEEFVGQQQLRDNLAVFIAAARGRRDAARPRAAAWPARPRQDHAGADRGARAGRRLPHDVGPGDRARRRSRRAAHQSRAARRAVHRRDPSPQPGGRGDPLSGDGGFPARPHHRRGAGRALGAHRPAALHADRRHHAVGPLTTPLRERFGIPLRLQFYTPEELERIVLRGARVLGVELAASGAQEIAKRSRGTPRVAGRLLRRVRDFAAVDGAKRIDAAAADAALKRLDVDAQGLDAMDRRFLQLHRRATMTAARSAWRRSPPRSPSSATSSRT